MEGGKRHPAQLLLLLIFFFSPIPEKARVSSPGVEKSAANKVEGGDGEWALQKIAAGNQSFCEVCVSLCDAI